MRHNRRRLYMGILTVLGIKVRGFFIPYRYAGDVPPLDKRAPYVGLERIFQAQEQAFSQTLHHIQGFADDLKAIGAEQPPQPRWGQDWFPRLDAMTAYAMVRTLKPRRIVEVGSGHSTRFFARAVRDGNLDVSITAIDPAPRADISQLNVNVVQSTVQKAGLDPFADLQDGDVLSIDSSHILMPGSDVDFLFNVVMPNLPVGVVVHIHDIFLPGAYPACWQWRGYNEQLGVAGLLQGQGYEILWSSQYVLTHMEQAVKAIEIIEQTPCPDGAFETSLWLQKRA